LILLAAAAVLVAAWLLVSSLGRPNATAAAKTDAAVSAAQALAEQPVLGTDPADSDVTQRIQGDAALRAVAARLQGTVALPPRGTFDNIDWKSIGSSSPAGVQSFLEYNASCQWYRYWLSGRTSGSKDAAATALGVIQQIPDWPSFQGQDSGRAAAVLAQAAADDNAAPIEQQIAANCG
jgi:hypothetical protein